SMISYRDGHEVDVGALARLRAAVEFSPLPPETLAAQIAGARWAIAAYDNDRLVGFARAISDGVRNAYIGSVMVDPDYQRRGIGREIIRRLIAERDDIRWVLHARKEAKEFYAAIGFTLATDMMWAGRR